VPRRIASEAAAAKGRYTNPVLPVLIDMQKCHPEV
jgi:hypothetical protein